MEGARSPSPREDLELLALGRGQPDEQKPLNGTVQVIPLSVEEPCPAQESQRNPWSLCENSLTALPKPYMVLTMIFKAILIETICQSELLSVTYIDEDENEILELSSNKTFLVVFKIPEECTAEEEWPHLLMERLTHVYASSPSLSHCFTSVEMTDFSGENATVAFNLQFGVPSEDDDFMKYRMNKELVRGVLLQNLHDQGVSGCETLGLDPASLLLYG
uniref:Chromosome 3 open reading frame 52 n=1 Tax=Neovison vison TaxID=452646 RepID=A0A8C7B8C1_NEOVI